jgi:hypothetical protein
MRLHAATHCCEELKGSGKCGCLLVPYQAVVVNDAIGHCPLSTVHCPLSTVQVFRIPDVDTGGMPGELPGECFWTLVTCDEAGMSVEMSLIAHKPWSP